MDWTECFNCAVAYIEEHLTEKIDSARLARIAGCSSYYFQKTFLYVAGFSVSEYIRRRRMTLAAAELRTTQKKIVDVALKYGYDSPTAFNRAFQSVHGVPPSAVRQKNVSLKAYPVLSFHFALSGAHSTAFKIEQKPSFQILGVGCPLDKKLENNFAVIPGQWDKALADGTLSRLSALMDGEPRGLLGVSVHHTEDWRYLIAVSSARTSPDFEAYRLPQADWAVFSGRGTNRTLQELERHVILNWLPASGYDCAALPDIEVYLKADPQDAVFEYWLPVVKKR